MTEDGDVGNKDRPTDPDILLRLVDRANSDAAEKRIKNKELTAEVDKFKSELEKIKFQVGDFDTVKSRVTEQDKLLAQYKELDDKKKLDDLSEVEKLKITLQDRESKFMERDKLHKKDTTKLTERISELESSITEGNNKFNEVRIANVVGNVVSDKGFKFRSKFERQGFLNTVLKKKEDSSYLTDDEVQVIVAKFVEDNTETPEGTPGKVAAGGGTDNRAEVSIARFHELKTKRLSGRGLTSDESKEYNSLINEIAEATK